ncbi:MAG TPA: hypothetical protein VE442_12585 [Jatrophihabitans sp.]|nr:hypothetical protein [Jatrophihabitans sp.]
MVRSRQRAAADPARATHTVHGGYDEHGEDARREAAQVAGQRIGADLDDPHGARPLSGRLGAATLDVVLPREIARVWPLIANLDITNASGPKDAVVGNEFSMSSYDREEDGFVGTDGQIICQWTQLEEPTRVAMTWRWTGTAENSALRLPRFDGQGRWLDQATFASDSFPVAASNLLGVW